MPHRQQFTLIVIAVTPHGFTADKNEVVCGEVGNETLLSRHWTERILSQLSE